MLNRMTKENDKFIEGLIDGYLAVRPTGTLASFLPWPKRWISCDLLDGLLHIYNKQEDADCFAVIHLPGSEYAVDAKEPLQFSVTVKHPTVEQHFFRADTNEDYTLWIDTVRACGASSRTARRTLSSTTSYSSRSSLISRCSSTDTDHGIPNGDDIEGITKRLQSLEESVYCSDDRLSDAGSDKTKHTLHNLQNEVEYLKKSLESCVSSISFERKEHRYKERLLEGEKIELMNDKLAIELTSEQNLKYKHSLELAQQMCINARQWETRYLRLSLEYLKLHTFLQHVDSGFVQQNAISGYLENTHLETVKTIAEHTECSDPPIDLAVKSSTFVDPLGFRNQFDCPSSLSRYMCQQRLPHHILVKLEPTETLSIRWTKLLERNHDCIKRSKETKELCRLGVPSKLRARLWKAFINHRCSKIMKAKGPRYYQSLVQSPELSPSDKQISLDLHRSFPRNLYFNSDNGTKVPVLQRVLVAFSLHNRAIGYCQGMNMIAGMLIFHLEEEQAFWGLVAILEMIMPSGYYNTDLLAARADQIIFQELVERKMPYLAAYLKHHDIDLSLFSFNWFMTIFIDSLPMDTVVRLWDLFLLEGHKTLLRFSLSLVKLHEYALMQHQDSVSIFNMFRATARSFYDSDLIIKLAFSEFHPFPKRNELYKRHSEKLSDLRTEHAEKEREWRERQLLHDTVDGDTWDIVPKQSVSPDPPVSCILYTALHDTTMWAVHSDKTSGVQLLKIQLKHSTVVTERSETIDNKVMCCVYTASQGHHGNLDHQGTGSGYILLGTSNGYVLSYDSDTLTKLWSTWVMDCVHGILVYQTQILAHLTNGSLVKFEGISESGLYSPSILDVGTSPIRTGILVKQVPRKGADHHGNLDHHGNADELWCSSGNTLHFVDLDKWAGCGKLSISTHTSTQIHGLVAYSTNIVFISVHSTISCWDVGRKVCLSSHDCSSVFLPPPSPKSKNYQGLRMSIHSLYYHNTSNTFWVGTSHGHVLIYELGKLPEEAVESRDSKPTNQDASKPPTRSSVSDEETSIAVLNEADLTPCSVSPSLGVMSRDFLGANRKAESESRDFLGANRKAESESRDQEENSITVLSEENHGNLDHHGNLDPQDTPLVTDVMKSSTALETSLVMIPSSQEVGGSRDLEVGGSRDLRPANQNTLSGSRDSLSTYDSFNGPLSSSPNIGKFVLPPHRSTFRARTNTYNEYDVMEDHCDIIESPTDNDLSPVHVYQTFNRYHSQENLDELELQAGEFELISDTKHQSNVLTLNTYQILSGDPIANISTVHNLDHHGNLDHPGNLDQDTTQIMTCGGSIEQEGVIVLWNKIKDGDKIRWQAQPVSTSPTPACT